MAAANALGVVMVGIGTGMLTRYLYDSNRDLIPPVITLSLMIGIPLLMRRDQ